MGKNKSKSSSIRAGGSLSNVDAEAINAGRDININLGERASRKPAIISNVPTPSTTFIKRKNLTARIHKALQANPEQVVVRQAVTRAMGGYGKTVAAILYAHEYQSDYPGGRFFLSVESGDLITALASLVGPLELPSANNSAADAALVSQTLRTGGPSLLILDNVASAAAWQAMLDSGLVPRGGCRVLITTRDEAIDPADAIKVGRLEPAEAREVYRLFCEHRRDKEQDETKRAALPAPLPSNAVADEITAWLGGLAVSVAAVAAYMKLKPRLAWESYWNGDGKLLRGLKNTPLEELPEVKPEVAAQLGIDGKPLEDHRRTLRVIDDAFDALPAPERRAVEYAALLPQDLAPMIWLEQLLEADAARAASVSDGTPDTLKLTLTADPDVGREPALAVLDHLDELDILLPGGEEGKLLSLHRLWHTRVNERAAASGVNRNPLLLAIAACANARRSTIVGSKADGSDRGVDDPAALTDQSLRWELTPLAQVCSTLWRSGHYGPAAQVGVWLAAVLRHMGRYAEATACLQLTHQNEAAVNTTIGHADLASGYSNLAMIQQDQGDLSGARASMERAITIESQHFTPDDPTVALSWSNLARIQHDQRDLPRARVSVERAIAIASKQLGPHHPTLAVFYSNLAMIQKDQSDLQGARASIERAIGIESRHFDPHHPNFAIRYSNLGTIQHAQWDLPGARASMERAIAIITKHHGPDHPHLALAYSNLAYIAVAQGSIPEAVARWRWSYSIHLKTLGPDHPHTKDVTAALRHYDPPGP